MMQLYVKQDDVKFSIVNFPYLCRNIPSSTVYGVYISRLSRSVGQEWLNDWYEAHQTAFDRMEGCTGKLDRYTDRIL
jgi:hypothetical protein